MYAPWPQTARPVTSSSFEGNHGLQNGYHLDTDRPPPMEPRPTLHTRLTESTGRLGLQDSRSYQDSSHAERQSRTQKLPALRDVLSQDYSPMPAHRPTDIPASTGHSVPTNPYQPEGYHPPMVLPSPPVADHRYWLESTIRYGISGISEGRQMHPIPSPGFHDNPNPRQRYADIPLERPVETTSTSQTVNGTASNYHDQATPEEVQPRMPTTASSRASRLSQSQSTSDGHGKYLRVEEVPGEGEFYVYEDGHRIPTYIDGESVNPNWGLTKANKPRKRLATACLDCREKKIKCEPGLNSCVQCEKAMRPCRKAADKFSQADTPTNVMYVAGSPVRKGPPMKESNDAPTRPPESEHLHKRRIRADPSPPLEPVKKPRDRSPPLERPFDGNRPSTEDSRPATSGGFVPPDSMSKTRYSWDDDPYAVEPAMTSQLLELYFDHINNAAYSIFPRRHFLRWMKEYEHKCQNERMVLYAMLAAASVFAGDHFSGFGKECFHVAGAALGTQLGKFNIATASSKLLLAFYHHAKGAEASEWDYIGSAIRTVTNIGLNSEAGCLDDAVSRGQQRYEFAFSPQQLAECKRRVLWCTFFQDRFCNPTVCSLKPEDIFIRLPCAEEAYESGIKSDAPLFANGIVDSDNAGHISDGGVAPLAWLIPIVAAWGDVTDFIFRASHRSGTTYRTQYQSFYSSMETRLNEWLESLPERFQYSTQNLARSIQEGYSQTFVLMHVLHHYSMIKLNRYMRHRFLQDVVIRNIRAANYHAHEILDIVNHTYALSKEFSSQTDSERPVISFTSPIIVFAITAAVDIVSAGGHDSKLKYTLDKIDQALWVLHELEQYWNVARTKMRDCQLRHAQLVNVTQKPKGAQSGCWMGRKWGTRESLEPEFGRQNDCIYGLGEREGDEASQLYFEAFNED